MGTLFQILLLIGSAFLVGVGIGFICQKLGFSGVEMFFSYRGTYQGCSLVGLILSVILFAYASTIFQGLFGVCALTLAGLALCFWGFLHGIVLDIWKLLHWGGKDAPPD